ncbi:hypothetical protein Q3G72_010222 [Acer saccharum]|nr:hypothetical protein Q3G72_010222 [Acer saccharum]
MSDPVGDYSFAYIMTKRGSRILCILFDFVPLAKLLEGYIFGAVRWSTSAGRPAPLTGANRPVARRWSCAGVDQRRPPAPIAQYGAAGLALVARLSPALKPKLACALVLAGPPAQVHQRTE